MSTPPRPTRHDPAVKRAAALAILPIVKAWLRNNTADDQAIVSDLICCADSDSYRFAKRLDDRGWGPDAELTEILEGFDTRATYRALVRSWVIDHSITVSQKIGDVVVLRGVQARVVAIYPETAEIVAQPIISDGKVYGETGGWVHPTEDAAPAPSVSEERA